MGPFPGPPPDWLWAPVDWIARNGFLGVDIFFVISGFVIALSVSKGAPTFGYFGRFIVRRSIRLDPPYWSSILLEVLLLHLSLRLFSDLDRHAAVDSAAGVRTCSTPRSCWATAAWYPSTGRSATRSSSTLLFVGLVVLHAKLPERLRGQAWLHSSVPLCSGSPFGRGTGDRRRCPMAWPSIAGSSSSLAS